MKSDDNRRHSDNFLQETESMAFKGRDPFRSKTVISNKIIEKVNSFNCVANLICYEKEMNTDNK
jgi:hypothetical protein